YGLRTSAFTLTGPGIFRTYADDGEIVAEEQYTSSGIVKNYITLEPRISMNLQLDNAHALKASYNRNAQNMHLLSNSTSTLPTDLWIMSSNNVKTEIADQGALGYYQNLQNN